MLKFSIEPKKFGYKLIFVSMDEKHFARVWTYSKSPAWFVSIRERKPKRFVESRKLLALNEALKYVEDKNI